MGKSCAISHREKEDMRLGYQEILVRSSKLSLEYMSGIIQRKMDPMFIDQADTIATLRNDFTSNKMNVFEQQVDTDPLDFKAGDRFLVVCGERDALGRIKSMFPITQRKSIDIYPMEFVMQSVQYNGKDYKDVFKDTKVEVVKHSIRQKLAENKRQIDGNQKDRTDLSKTEDKTIERKSYEER